MTVETKTPLLATLAEARKAPLPEGRLSALLMEHGTMQLRHYKPPQGGDPQKPHDQDELYVVMNGSGWFRCDDQRVKFGPGDVLYAGAGAVHRFEDYSKDTELWVVFYGAKGGEA
ncbi:MAG: cupin domain-containing protein [Alphaproteobacteria bacterium]|nr:cupin domain-containing protein [Alphaproteobacteria bacterium]